VRDDEREIEADLRATVEARRDLGPEYESELVAGFVERIDDAVARRVDAELERRGDDDDNSWSGSFVLGIVSLGTGIPITAIAGGTAELPGVIAAWAGIVGVNLAMAFGQRARRR
jgi:hypothetical protein